MKEQGTLKNEEMKDARDFETYKIENFGHPLLAPVNMQNLQAVLS